MTRAEGCGRPRASPGDVDTWQTGSQERPGARHGASAARSVPALGWLGTCGPTPSVWEEKSLCNCPAPPGGTEGHPPTAPTCGPHPGGGTHVAHTVRNALSKEGAAGRNGKTRRSSRKGVIRRLHPLSPGGEDPPACPEEVGGESEWIKCLIPTAHPSVQLRRESGRGHPYPLPTTQPPSVPNPSLLCSPQKDGGPPGGPRGRAGCPPSILLCWGVGAGSGETGVPPSTPPLPVPYILERHPLPGASAQRGTTVCTFISP